MLKIIKNKFNNHIDYEFPHTKIEILGFIYSAIFEDFGDFKLSEPYFPTPLMKIHYQNLQIIL